jgi:3-isopropylmalate/(R)-2-methylmalate dehydratase small subunit
MPPKPTTQKTGPKPDETKSMPPISGNAWRFGDDVSTDDIISGVYLTLSIPEMAPYTFAAIRPEFAKQVKPNDIVVGGRNFGIGSSREEAPAALRVLNVGAIIAASFARIFFRNAFNLGLPAIEMPSLASNPDLIRQGDQLELYLDRGTVLNRRTGKTLETAHVPDFLLEYVRAGGAIPLLKRQIGSKREK